MINMQPSAVAMQMAEQMSSDGPWRIVNDQGLVHGSECPTESMATLLLQEREQTGLAGTNEHLLAPWRQDGVGKCRKLVLSGGDEATPHDRVLDTLTVGLRLANEDDRPDVHHALECMLETWTLLEAGAGSV